MIEDVVTSGGQVIESCRQLREHGADIAAVLCVIDREAGGRENLAAEGLDLRSLFTMSQLRDGRVDRSRPLVTTDSAPAYDRIGVRYSDVRRADPRFEAAIWEALGDAQTVLNIGAGAGLMSRRIAK